MLRLQCRRGGTLIMGNCGQGSLGVANGVAAIIPLSEQVPNMVAASKTRPDCSHNMW